MKLAVMIACTTLLAACVNSQILEKWPEQIPKQSYFRALYRSDTPNSARQSELEYLTWVARFYEGWEMMPIGWDDISASVLVDLEPAQYRAIDTLLQRLGVQISGEWAKDNDVRLIDSRMLSLWAGVMQAEYSPQYRMTAVDVIARDVNRILSSELAPTLVNESRYERLLGMSLEP